MVSAINLRSVITKGIVQALALLCEAEIRYLETQLRERKRKGWGMKVAGLAAGLCVATVPLTSCQNTPKACNVENKAQDSTDMPVMGDTVVIPKALTADLKNAIVIIGRVLDLLLVRLLQKLMLCY